MLNVNGSDSLYWKTGLDLKGLQSGAAGVGGILSKLTSQVSALDVFAGIGLSAVYAFQKVAKGAYDMSKAEAEKSVLRAAKEGLNTTVLSPTAVIGPHDFKPSFLGSILLFYSHWKRLPIVKGGFDWVDARDVAKAAVRAGEYEKNGERFILSGTWLSLRDIFELVGNTLDKKFKFITVPMWLASTGTPLVSLFFRMKGKQSVFTRGTLNTLKHHRLISHEKASRELKFNPRPIQETIRDTMDWYIQHGYLKIK